MRRRKVLFILALLLLLAGTGLLLYPGFRQMQYTEETTRQIRQYQRTIDAMAAEESPAQTEVEQPQPSERRFPALYQAFQQYNAQLRQNGQAQLYVQGGYTAFPVALQTYGFPDDMIGYLTIPAIDLQMPLLLGASEENLAAGATILGHTSAPIGGAGTNCVVAGHDCWHGAEWFSAIKTLQTGDEIAMTTPWETRVYGVSSTTVIRDDDFNSITLQPEEDLLTLITCHMQDGIKMRYVVYCRFLAVQP